MKNRSAARTPSIEEVNASFDARLIEMMAKPKSEKLQADITLRVSNADKAGNLREQVRQAFEAWQARKIGEAGEAPAAPAVGTNEVIFVIDLMMKRKTRPRREEIKRRVGELKTAGLFGAISEAYHIWQQVPVGGVVSKHAPPPAAAAQAAQEAASEVPDVVIPARKARTDGPEPDREEKIGKHRRPPKRKPADAKAAKGRLKPESKGRRRTKPQADMPDVPVKPKAGPALVLKGTSHPKGEPLYSPFAALAALAIAGEGAQA